MENQFRFYNTLTRKIETVIPHEDGKIKMYTCGPTFDVAAMKDWLNESPDNYYLCDATGMGNVYEELKSCSNLLYTPYISGKSIQSVERLSQKALANIESYLTASANNK